MKNRQRNCQLGIRLTERELEILITTRDEPI